MRQGGRNRNRRSRAAVILAVISLLLSGLLVWQQIVLARQAGKLAYLEQSNESLSDHVKELGQELAYYEHEGDGIRAHGQLRVEGARLVDQKGNSLQLRGVSSHGLAWYPRYSNGAALAFWKEAGANVYRASMYSDQEKGYVHNPEESSNYLFQAVENALANDIYAVVDWHILIDGNPLEHMEEAKKFFEEVSSHYRDHPGIIYEICNEPNGDTTWEDITGYADEVIPLIRQNAPNAVILVGMPNHSTDFRPVLEAPLPYENIMYTYHQYVDGQGGDYDAYGLKKLIEQDCPVFVSEWGVGKKAMDVEEIDFTAAEEFLDMLEEYGISWLIWSLSNRDDSRGLLKPDTKVYGDFAVDDLNQVGRFVYERLNIQKPVIYVEEAY